MLTIRHSPSVCGVVACLLKNEPASQRHVARLTRVCGVVVAKANPNEGVLVACSGPEAG